MSNDSIYLLEERGDDYHGSRILEAFETLEDANHNKSLFESSQEPCHACGHEFSYVVNRIAYTPATKGASDE